MKTLLSFCLALLFLAVTQRADGRFQLKVVETNCEQY
jgi:hypothetical protein